MLTLLPVRPAPQPDELLSSWVLRLVQANGFRLREFYGVWLGSANALCAQDIDVRPHEPLLALCADKTGRSVPALRQLSLEGLEGCLYESLTSQRHPDWVLARCTLPKTHHAKPAASPGPDRAGLQFCPHCLASDERPYFRRTWRLAWATVCTRHRCALADRCPACQAPVQLQRAGVWRRRVDQPLLDLDRCTACHADLTQSKMQMPAEEGGRGDVCPQALWLQAQCEQALQEGYAQLSDGQVLHALAFFSGLRHIASGFWRHEFSLRGERQDGRQGGQGGQGDQGANQDGRHDRMRLEWAGLQARAGILSRTAQALSDWPRSFLTLTDQMPAPYSHFLREARPRPFWFDHVCSAHLGRRAPATRTEELTAIKAAVRRSEGVFSPSAGQRLFGRHLYYPTRHDPRPRLDEDTAEMLLAAIDHQVSVSTGLERTQLLRDKVMLLAARVLRLRQYELSQAALNVAWLGKPMQEWGQLGWEMPRCAQTLRPWLWWYVARVRPQLPGAQHSAKLLPGQTREAGMSCGHIGQRFAQHVRAADLQRRIPDFRAWAAGA